MLFCVRGSYRELCMDRARWARSSGRRTRDQSDNDDDDDKIEDAIDTHTHTRTNVLHTMLFRAYGSSANLAFVFECDDDGIDPAIRARRAPLVIERCAECCAVQSKMR